MDSSILMSLRNEEGYIVIDSIESKVEQKEEIKGRRNKKWFIFDDSNILFKETNENTYEEYAEMLATEIFRQVGFETADYDLAILHGKKGVISRDFLKKGELIISGKTILKNYGEILNENLLNEPINSTYNTLIDIENALKIYTSDIKKTMKQLDLLFSIDCIMSQSDRHWRNWSIILSQINSSMRLAPQYDSSAICRFQLSKSNIAKYLRIVKRSKYEAQKRMIEYDMYSAGFDKTYLLRYDREKDNLAGVQLLEEAYSKEKSRFEYIIRMLPKKIDLDLAVETVEKRINSEIPKECKEWFCKVIEFNLQEINKVVALNINSRGGVNHER